MCGHESLSLSIRSWCYHLPCDNGAKGMTSYCTFCDLMTFKDFCQSFLDLLLEKEIRDDNGDRRDRIQRVSPLQSIQSHAHHSRSSESHPFHPSIG